MTEKLPIPVVETIQKRQVNLLCVHCTAAAATDLFDHIRRETA